GRDLRERNAAVREPPHPRLEPRTIVVDDRHVRIGIDVVRITGYPVPQVVDEQREPVVQPSIVDEPGLQVQEALDLLAQVRAHCHHRGAPPFPRAAAPSVPFVAPSAASSASISRFHSAYWPRSGVSSEFVDVGTPFSTRSRCRPRLSSSHSTASHWRPSVTWLNTSMSSGEANPAGPETSSWTRRRMALTSLGACRQKMGCAVTSVRLTAIGRMTRTCTPKKCRFG